MAKHFIITGMPRSGTTWLSYMLSKHPNAGVDHEPFKPGPDSGKKLKEWLNRNDKEYIGAVNCFARLFVGGIQKQKTMPWGMVWRNPADLVISIWRWWIQSGRWSADQLGLEEMAYWIFSDLEFRLSLMWRAEVDFSIGHWHMNYFLTEEGLNHLAETIGIPFNPPIKPDHKTERRNVCKKETPYPEWKDERRALVQLSRSFPRVRLIQDILQEQGVYFPEKGRIW